MIDNFVSQFTKRPPKERAAILGMMAVGLAVMTVFILFLLGDRVILDKYGCPKAGPVLNKIFVIDRTGQIPKSAQRAIRINIEAVVKSAPLGTRFTLFEIDSKYMRGLSSAKFSMCKLRDGSQASPYNENPELIRRQYIKAFQAPLLLALDAVLIGTGQPRSPILEAMVDMTSVEAFQIPAPTTVYLFSDMLQHTEVYSQYSGVQDFQAAVMLPEVQKMIPSLAGADVHIYYLLRNGKERDLQNNTHALFWFDYFKVAHANVQLIKKIR